MADVPDSMTPTNPMGQGTEPTPAASTLGTPGMITFAAIMMFLFGSFQFVWALVEYFNGVWYGAFSGHPWLWAVFDIAFALAALYAGFDMLAGGWFGRVFGLIVAGLSAIRWFFYLPAAPWVAIVIIAIDVLIIYALAAHAEYFGARSHSPS